MAKPLNIAHPFENVDIATLRSAIEASRSPLIITDNRLPDNPIIYSNQAFEDLTGYPLSEIIGQNCRFLQGDDTKKTEIAGLRNAVKSGDYQRSLLKNYRKDGTAFWNDLIISPVTDSQGKVTHFIGMQLDVTDRIEATEQLATQKRQLEQSVEEMEQFTYATSHDLQEPLRMISSYLQLINRRYGDTLDEDARTFLDFAAEGADRMQALINDLLLLSRLDMSTDTMKPIAMDTVIERALFNLKAATDETDARVTVGKLPKIRVDAVQMTQLFQNLIGNAIKYRQKDVRPEVTVSYEHKRGKHVFSVADNGIGIAKKQQKRVFQVFQRLHTQSEYKGTGVGLAICSKIIDRHGGEIWVESDTNQGSVFYFSIPDKERA